MNTVQTTTIFAKDATSFERACHVLNRVTTTVGLKAAPIFLLYSALYGTTPFHFYARIVAGTLLMRSLLQHLVTKLVYPATMYNKQGLLSAKVELIKKMQEAGFTVNEISLRTGTGNFHGLQISKKENVGKWMLYAAGNGESLEKPHFVRSEDGEYPAEDGKKYKKVYQTLEIAEENAANGLNTLILNGPSVGESDAWPTRHNFGAGFEAALSYLESLPDTTAIVMKGRSLGGGMMAEAISQHLFLITIKYIAVMDRTFSRVSEAAGEMVKPIKYLVKAVFLFIGLELDGIKAARKLESLKIQQIIIQNSATDQGTDGVISNKAGLALALSSKPSSYRTILSNADISEIDSDDESPKIRHNYPLPEEVNQKLWHSILANMIPARSF